MCSSYNGKSVYGVNSTFSAESTAVSDIYKLTKKSETSASLSSHISQRLRDRSDSSESGSESIGGTIYSKEFPRTSKSSESSLITAKSPKSAATTNSKLDTETWPDLSIACIDGDEPSGFTKEIMQGDMYNQILEDLLDHERSAARDFRIVCEVSF
ncbi:hypothetical protein ANCCAN_15886 [Ancylostoma caninum]|uniref:Uncharacterized protein n=1 Tax=Ancylostoma caninum TaxID=29170 RepID=A0A368G5D7_ANCCA|nr:hypothetical protein ANCCAN_15886 [Ancylostoma caninum]